MMRSIAQCTRAAVLRRAAVAHRQAAAAIAFRVSASAVPAFHQRPSSTLFIRRFSAAPSSSSTNSASAAESETAAPFTVSPDAHSEANAEPPEMAEVEATETADEAHEREEEREIDESWRFVVPPPVIPSSHAELEELKTLAYDGELYDPLACYQLGQLFFEGVTAEAAAKSAAEGSADGAASTPAAAASTETAAAGAAASASVPWSLPKNHTQSLLWYTNAAFEGHVPSRTRLGVMYLAGYGIKKRVDIAFQLFGEASEEGDRDAQAHLASMWLAGVGAPQKDVSKAVEFYTAAAEQGHVRAQATLAKLLNAPESASVYDPVKASHWLNEAARQNHTDSQLLLASKLESTDPLQSFRWYEAAAKGGNAQAQYIVGLAHVRNTVPVDPATASAAPSDLLARLSIAARWFALAADHGHALAQTRLGFLCYHGVGTKQDESTGLMWLGNAAEGNQVDAQLLLGSIAYDEHASQQLHGTAPPAGSKDEGKKLQAAKHYFDKVLENANKNCTTLPPGSLPLLVRFTQDPSLPSRTLLQYKQRNGQPWIGDINVLLAEVLQAEAAAAAAENKP